MWLAMSRLLKGEEATRRHAREKKVNNTAASIVSLLREFASPAAATKA